MIEKINNEITAPRHVRTKQSDIENTLPPVSVLLGDKEQYLQYVDLDGQPQKLAFRGLAAHDPWPIPMPIDRENYGSVESSANYWSTGYGDWLNVSEALERYVKPEQTDSKLRLLDFGCATGRFLRHAWIFGGEKIDCWGCDFATANIDWMKRHLPRDIKTVLNTDIPHLPFPDDYFDICTAFSVMTHIDSMEDAWLLELRRVTNPNGLLYLTIQNEATWTKVADRPGSLDHLMRANLVPGNLEISEEVVRNEMPQDRIALRMSREDIYNCNVWHSNDYVRQNWSRYFEILHIADNGHTKYQSPCIMKPISYAKKVAEPQDRSSQKKRSLKNLFLR